MSKFKEAVLRILAEAKQVGPLYHSTDLKGLLNILKTKTLISANPQGISFTRDKNFIYNKAPFTLVLDGNKVSENNIVEPYDYGSTREEFGTRKEKETAVLPGGHKRPDFINKKSLDWWSDKVLKLKNDYVKALIINTKLDDIEKIKEIFSSEFPNAQIIDKTLKTENSLAEGEKKIFDKDSGYNTSKDEEFMFEKIKEKWPDVEKSVTLDDFRNPENNRPWQVDAYVPSERMMIQINKNWKHGRRPYDPNDPECQADVRWLKSQNGDYYDKVLYTWTQLEPLKRQIANENGYRYVELFNLDEFNTWYENPELTYEEYKYPTRLKYDSDEYFRQKDRGRDIFGNDVDPYGA